MLSVLWISGDILRDLDSLEKYDNIWDNTWMTGEKNDGYPEEPSQ